MKANQSTFYVILGITILAICFSIVQANETPPIQWNELAQSQILDNTELLKLVDAFPAWQMKQITWPSASEIGAKKVAVDPNLTASCIGWFTKFIKTNQLPSDLSKHLIPMKEWGLISKESEQRRLCDIFIVRYKMEDYLIHIQESPCNVIIAVADERLAKSPRTDHKSLVIEMAQAILSDSLKPNSDPKFFHVDKIGQQGKISRISWTPEKVGVIDKNGKTCILSDEAWKIGTAGVEAETDGRFVKFEIFKTTKGPRVILDPYVQRF